MDSDLDPRLLKISELVGESVDGNVDPEIDRDGKARVTQAIAEQGQSRRTAWQSWAVVALVAGAVGVAASTGYLALRRGQALSYQVMGGSVGEGGYVDGSGSSPGATIRFSEGTEATLAEGARARITAVGESGARIALENGRATLNVIERSNAAWSVDAGPFVIRAAGAEFDVDWSGIDGTLEIELRKGALTVSGPAAPGGLALRAGQHLVVRDGHLRVEALSAESSARSAEILRELAIGASFEATPSDAAAQGSLPAVAGQSWAKQVAAGGELTVLAEAERRGFEACYAKCSLADLIALADAARAAGRTDVARGALLAQRSRFLASGAARTAAFLLGRVAEDSGETDESAEWYDRYLREAPSGPLAAEALGREMTALGGSGQHERAQALARQYLERYPTGPFATVARELLEPKPL